MVRRACCAILLLTAGIASAQSGGGGGRDKHGGRGGFADPSVIIAAELAYDRVAVEKGQWTALSRIVAKDAVLFQPRAVFAEKWLSGQHDPATPVRWQTRSVFMACDGSVAVSTGRWLRPGSEGEGARGWFTNIWRRGKKGYQLILNHDGPLATAAGDEVRGEDDLEAISARVATCPKRGRGPGSAAGPGGEHGPAGPAPVPVPVPVIAPLDPSQPVPTRREDGATDGTLRWRWSVAPDGARTLEAWMATEEGEARVLDDHAVGTAPTGALVIITPAIAPK